MKTSEAQLGQHIQRPCWHPSNYITKTKQSWLYKGEPVETFKPHWSLKDIESHLFNDIKFADDFILYAGDAQKDSWATFIKELHPEISWKETLFNFSKDTKEQIKTIKEYFGPSHRTEFKETLREFKSAIWRLLWK